MSETADDWLLRFYESARYASTKLRARFSLTAEERPYDPNGRYGAVRWSSQTAFITFFADLWEDHRHVAVGVRQPGGTAVTELGLNVESAYGALGIKPPSRKDYAREELSAWMARQVQLAELLVPVLRGDLDYEQRVRAANEDRG
jgi:hypothetical protein